MTSNKPLLEITHGRVTAVIWPETHDGRTRFNVTFTRRYQRDDCVWDAACFQHDDLASLTKLAGDAREWISEQRQELRNRGEGTC